MQHQFRVTGLGLKIDGVMIMPGSEVILNARPPAHWQRFGEASTGEEKPKPAPKEFEVATPEHSKRRGRPRKSESDEE